jgi:hypothetical protein
MRLRCCAPLEKAIEAARATQSTRRRFGDESVGHQHRRVDRPSPSSGIGPLLGWCSSAIDSRDSRLYAPTVRWQCTVDFAE